MASFVKIKPITATSSQRGKDDALQIRSAAHLIRVAATGDSEEELRAHGPSLDQVNDEVSSRSQCGRL
jgi:hypothetical protein